MNKAGLLVPAADDSHPIQQASTEATLAKIGGEDVDFFVHPGVAKTINGPNVAEFLRRFPGSVENEVFQALIGAVNLALIDHHRFARELVALRQELEAATADRDLLRQQLEAATADRDRVRRDPDWRLGDEDPDAAHKDEGHPDDDDP